MEVRSLGLVPVKGLPDPVEVYELTGAGTARSRLQATASRGLTPFVGRDPELAHLVRAQEQARGGHGQLLAIVGEAGVGKSRLYHEFIHSHRVQGWLVLQASAVSHGKSISYLPVIDLLKAYCKLEERDDHRALREKITGKLFTLDESLKPLLPAFFGLLDVPVDDPQWQALDPAQRRHQTLDANKRLLLREAQAQPVVVIFEDLHWVDTETQALLDSLVASLPAARLLMLVNYRPEYQHAWGSKTYYTQLRLDALPAENAGELLEGLLGGDPGLAPLKALLTERTSGNPLFLEESVRTLVETRALTGHARRLPARPAGRGDPGAGHGPVDPGLPDRPPAARREASPAVRRGDRKGRPARASPRDRRAPGGGRSGGDSPISRPPSSCTRRTSSRTSSTRSSTR